MDDALIEKVRQAAWVPGFMLDLVLLLVIGLSLQGHWSNCWRHLMLEPLARLFRGQLVPPSLAEHGDCENVGQAIAAEWLGTWPQYSTEWSPGLLTDILSTMPARHTGGAASPPHNAWNPKALRIPVHLVDEASDPRTRVAIFALAVGPSFLIRLSDTMWGADGHLAALLGVSSFSLAANRTAIHVTGAPGSGKTRACAFLGVLLTGMAQRCVLYTAHGNESVRTFAETVDGLLTQGHDSVRGLVVRVPARKEKDKLLNTPSLLMTTTQGKPSFSPAPTGR